MIYFLQPTVAYTVPENSSEGPVLEAGPDFSKDRKNDYPTETNDEWEIAIILL